jgi:hypothetical protein
MWVELTVPVPPGLAELCSYPGEARHVGLCWQPCGDECEYDDGRLSGTGSWAPYLAYTQHRAVAPALLSYDLGASDSEPKHLLIIDRVENKASVADLRTGRDFLRQQGHPPLPEIGACDAVDTLAAFLDVGKLKEVPIDEEAVEARMRRQAEQTRELLRFLDRFLDAGEAPSGASNPEQPREEP